MSFRSQLIASLTAVNTQYLAALAAFQPVIAALAADVMAATNNKAAVTVSRVSSDPDKTVYTLLLQILDENGHEKKHFPLDQVAVCSTGPAIRAAGDPAGLQPLDTWVSIADAQAAQDYMTAMAADPESTLVKQLAELMRS